MSRLAVMIGILPLAALSAGWTGSGAGDLRWSAPGAAPMTVPLEAVGTVTEGLQAVAHFDLPGARTGVLSLRVASQAINRGGRSFSDPGLALGYTEYDEAGLLVFVADPGRIAGRVHVVQAGQDVEVGLTVALRDRDEAQVWRDLREVRFALVPVIEPEPAGGGGGVVIAPDLGWQPVPGGDPWGDDDDWDDDDWDDDDWDDDDWEDSGCGGDDWESSSSSSDSGGCSGDDWDSSSGGGDSSGCEGDDLGAEGGDSGCEGDAIAGGRRRQGSPLVARAVTWLPWLLVFAFVRLARRGPRRRGA